MLFIVLAIVCLVIAVVVAFTSRNWLIAGIFAVLAVICFVLAGGHVGDRPGDGAPSPSVVTAPV